MEKDRISVITSVTVLYPLGWRRVGSSVNATSIGHGRSNSLARRYFGRKRTYTRSLWWVVINGVWASALDDDDDDGGGSNDSYGSVWPLRERSYLS